MRSLKAQEYEQAKAWFLFSDNIAYGIIANYPFAYKGSNLTERLSNAMRHLK